MVPGRTQDGNVARCLDEAGLQWHLVLAVHLTPTVVAPCSLKYARVQAAEAATRLLQRDRRCMEHQGYRLRIGHFAPVPLSWLRRPWTHHHRQTVFQEQKVEYLDQDIKKLLNLRQDIYPQTQGNVLDCIPA